MPGRNNPVIADCDGHLAQLKVAASVLPNVAAVGFGNEGWHTGSTTATTTCPTVSCNADPGRGTLYFQLHTSLQDTRFDFGGRKQKESTRISPRSQKQFEDVCDQSQYKFKVLGDSYLRGGLSTRWFKVRRMNMVTEQEVDSWVCLGRTFDCNCRTGRWCTDCVDVAFIKFTYLRCANIVLANTWLTPREVNLYRHSRSHTPAPPVTLADIPDDVLHFPNTPTTAPENVVVESVEAAVYEIADYCDFEDVGGTTMVEVQWKKHKETSWENANACNIRDTDWQHRNSRVKAMRKQKKRKVVSSGSYEMVDAIAE
jgi:hypothetical protein